MKVEIRISELSGEEMKEIIGDAVDDAEDYDGLDAAFDAAIISFLLKTYSDSLYDLLGNNTVTLVHSFK